MSSDRPTAADHRRAVLEERARKLSTPLVRSTDERRERYAIFRVGGVRIAFRATSIAEIVRVPTVAALPGLPPWVVGVAHVHGEPFAMLDVALLLGKGPSLRAEVAVVLESGGRTMGVLADEVVGLHELGQGDLAAGLASSDAVVTAITRELVHLVDVERLFGDPRVIVDSARDLPPAAGTQNG